MGRLLWPSGDGISKFLADQKPSNPVVITGDIHSSWANDVKLDYDNPASATIASEFVGTSITSDFPAAFIAPVNASLADNPHIRFFDGLNQRLRALLGDTRRVEEPTSAPSPRSMCPTLPRSRFARSSSRHGDPGVKPA